ncbi:MAG: CotH kinase family protein, partial [Bacteroidales bacterium]|nr:CotH kinase family protein [Bacteroidales bacterium]
APWPLISYLYSDPVFKQKYDGYIDEFIHGPFLVSKMTERFTEAHHLIAPFVTGSEGELDKYTFIPRDIDFDNSLDTLINFAATRYVEAADYLE